MNMFQIMATVLNEKMPNDEELKEIQPFIFCRYLGSNPHCLSIANYLNLYYNIPIKLQYLAVKQLLSGKLSYIKYISTKKDDNNQQILENLMKYYKISYNTAKEYIKFISKSELDKINKIFANN